jgi:hypothetical protein
MTSRLARPLAGIDRRTLFRGLGWFSAGIIAGEVVPAAAQRALPRLSSEVDDWTQLEFVADPVMNDQFRAHLCQMLHGAADLGECLDTASRIEPNSEVSWLEAWLGTAQRLHAQADASQARGHRESAASAYHRAANYYRASLIHHALPDARVDDICKRSRRCQDLAFELSGYPATAVEIPYEGTTLPGYLIRSPAAPATAPLLIMQQGRDAWPEDTQWVYENARRRGIHALIFHAPGQGLALRLGGLAFRPDWEAVIRPVVDFALGIQGVDAARLALMGLSFGGFLAPRAVAIEQRLKLCIANPGVLDWGTSIRSHFESMPGMMGLYERSPASFDTAMNTLGRLWPTAGWWLRDACRKHGVSTPHALFQELAKYDNTPFAERIRCKTLIMDGASEAFSGGQAQQLFDALRCPKDLMFFDAASTAQLHCQNGATAHAAERLFDWLADEL